MAPTPRLTPALIRALFTEALAQEFGICLPCEAAFHDRARTMIHTTMRDSPDRERIMVCAFPNDGEL